MNNTVYDVDFTRGLPAPLQNDETMFALGKVIAAELQENIRLSRLSIIYARIDELDEEVLDILARDLRVDWYDDSYPIEAKRAVIQDGVKVHKRLGTKYAIVTALGNVFPKTEVQEWFEYGGEPFTFRVIIHSADAEKIPDWKATAFYIVNTNKNLRSHLETLILKVDAICISTPHFFLLHSLHRLTLPNTARASPSRLAFRLSLSPFNSVVLARRDGTCTRDGTLSRAGYSQNPPYMFPVLNTNNLALHNAAACVPINRNTAPLFNAHSIESGALVSAPLLNQNGFSNIRLTVTKPMLRNGGHKRNGSVFRDGKTSKYDL